MPTTAGESSPEMILIYIVFVAVFLQRTTQRQLNISFRAHYYCLLQIIEQRGAFEGWKTRGINRKKKTGQASMMWLKVVVVVFAALMQLSGNASQIFDFCALDYCRTRRQRAGRVPVIYRLLFLPGRCCHRSRRVASHTGGLAAYEYM